jgi:hypothetical protein
VAYVSPYVFKYEGGAERGYEISNRQSRCASFTIGLIINLNERRSMSKDDKRQEADSDLMNNMTDESSIDVQRTFSESDKEEDSSS